MPFATIPNSTYLDLYGYRITDKSTVEAAYGIRPADVVNPTYGLNVALVLPRAQEPTFLSEDWATRQQTIAQYDSSNTLWSTFGADKQLFDTVKQQITDLGLKVIESADTARGDYVTSAESRTIWVELNNNSDFQKLFSSQTELKQGPPSSSNLLFWTGQLSLPTEWKINGLWFDISQDTANPSNLVPGVKEADLTHGPQGVGNASPDQPAAPPLTIAQGYDFPLNGPAVKTGTIALIEPTIGAALPPGSQSFQQLLTQYLATVQLTGTGQVYTQGAESWSDGSSNADERSLDVGTIAGVNPNSDIGLYVGSGSRGWAQSTIFTSIQSAIWDTGHNPAVISSSYNDFQSMPPSSPFYRANWELIVDAALRNQTLVHDAYDGGSGNELGNGLTNVFYNGTSPYSVVVGGTSLSSLTNAPSDPTLNLQIIQPALAGDQATIWQLVAGGLTSLPTNAAALANFIETPWNQYYVHGDKKIDAYNSGEFRTTAYTNNWATSGGVDITQGVPSYQSTYGLNPVTTDPQAAIGRGVPDVTALAGGNLNYLLPLPDMVGTGPNGGTSASAPLWATLASQFDFIFSDQGLHPLGYMTDLLYIASAIAPASFNDIMLGNNVSSFVAGQGTYLNGNSNVMPTNFGYDAGPGYDLVSGLGSPNGVLLGRALTAIAHEQTYFDQVPDVLNQAAPGGWTAGANETLSLQAMSSTGVALALNLGASSIGVSSGPSASFAWTSQLAGQVLQPSFDQALVRFFDGQSQAFATQVNLGVGQNVSVTINGATAQAVQGSLTADFGFTDFMTGQGVVRVAQAVMVAETAGGASDQTAIVRIRQNGTDSLAVTFYKVDDYTGAIGNLHPGDAGYGAAAQGRAYQLSTGATSIGGPGYGNFEQAAILNVDAGDLIAQTLSDRTTGHTYWAFASANEANVVHQWNYGLNVVGWEDMYGGGDYDFNDLVVGIDFTSASGSGWLV
jgi:hypothetical protein